LCEITQKRALIAPRKGKFWARFPFPLLAIFVIESEDWNERNDNYLPSRDGSTVFIGE
jgi:hypothetical protein